MTPCIVIVARQDYFLKGRREPTEKAAMKQELPNLERKLHEERVKRTGDRDKPYERISSETIEQFRCLGKYFEDHTPLIEVL